MILFIVVGVPLAFIWIMGLFEMFVERNMGWRQRFLKEGWDTCVMSLGLAGGPFADPEILTTLNKRSLYAPIGLLLACLIVSLLMAVMIAFLRRRDPVTGVNALLSLLFGGVTLIIPIYLALLR